MPDFLSNAKYNQVSPAGSITPMSFVCIDGIQGNFMCRQATNNAATTGDIPTGVSQVAQNIAPNLIYTLTQGITNPTAYAGNPGDQIQIFTSGDVCPIRLGANGATSGALLTNDTSGNAVMIAPFTSGRWRAGLCLQGGLQGDIVEMYIMPGHA